MFVRLIVFLVLNFGALGLGGIFTNDGVTSGWYRELDKAPWTPPGWVFGAAWITIMLCFSLYMTTAWDHVTNRSRLLRLFAMQWILNVVWNPVFFYYHNVLAAFVIISSLTILVGVFLFGYWSPMRVNSLWVAPYFIWLLIAASLNGYILIYN